MTDFAVGVIIFAVLAAVITSITFAGLSADGDDWTKINDNCYVHVHKNLHAIKPDKITRGVYCLDKGEN